MLSNATNVCWFAVRVDHLSSMPLRDSLAILKSTDMKPLYFRHSTVFFSPWHSFQPSRHTPFAVSCRRTTCLAAFDAGYHCLRWWMQQHLSSLFDCIHSMRCATDPLSRCLLSSLIMALPSWLGRVKLWP